MPIPHHSYPLPRGQFTVRTPELLQNQLMTGAYIITGAANAYPQIGLYNNSTTGALLYVVGWSFWSSDTASPAYFRLIDKIPNGATIETATPINPFVPMLEGEVVSTANGSHVGGNIVWMMAGNGVSDSWPVDEPFLIIPPGFAMYTDTQTVAITIGAAFRWITLRP